MNQKSYRKEFPAHLTTNLGKAHPYLHQNMSGGPNGRSLQAQKIQQFPMATSL